MPLAVDVDAESTNSSSLSQTETSTTRSVPSCQPACHVLSRSLLVAWMLTVHPVQRYCIDDSKLKVNPWPPAPLLGPRRRT